MTLFLPDVLIEPSVRAALAEDLGRAGDVTATACIPAGTRMAVNLVARRARIADVKGDHRQGRGWRRRDRGRGADGR
jgi:hypothetical protein